MVREVLGNMERRVSELKKMSEKTFDEYNDSNLHTVKFHVLEHIVKNIRRFCTVSVLDSSPFKYLNVHIKQANNELRKGNGQE